MENLTGLQKAQQKQREMREAGLIITRSPIEKFISNPRIGRAVKNFCFECNGYSRSDANNCTNRDCPLWLFRKGRSTPNPDEIKVWQDKYSKHMTDVGCLNAESDADDNDIEDDENITDDPEDED